jgi:hypothetical protein
MTSTAWRTSQSFYILLCTPTFFFTRLSQVQPLGGILLKPLRYSGCCLLLSIWSIQTCQDSCITSSWNFWVELSVSSPETIPDCRMYCNSLRAAAITWNSRHNRPLLLELTVWTHQKTRDTGQWSDYGDMLLTRPHLWWVSGEAGRITASTSIEAHQLPSRSWMTHYRIENFLGVYQNYGKMPPNMTLDGSCMRKFGVLKQQESMTFWKIMPRTWKSYGSIRKTSTQAEDRIFR